jgi:5-dehydro-2-deoxygluconokinase
VIKGNRFLVLGRAGLDLYADPPGTETEYAKAFSADLGGSAANIAVAIVKLGGSASLLSTVSDDAIGRYVLNALKDYGVGTDAVSTVKGESRTSLAVVESRLENCQSVIYRNGAADFQLAPDMVQNICFADFDALIITGTSLALEPSRSATQLAISMARNHGHTIIMDLDYRPYSWADKQEAARVMSEAANLCDIIVGNDVEFAVLAGSGDGLAKAKVLAASHHGVVVYKMGEKGSVAFVGDTSFQRGIYSVKALKPTGAGDAFMGGFVTGLEQGLSVEHGVERGSAAAAITVTRVGCAPAVPTTQELVQFMSTNTIT